MTDREQTFAVLPADARLYPCEHGYTGDERKSCACAVCSLLELVDALAWVMGRNGLGDDPWYLQARQVLEHRDD